jgi:hypothetical protein
MQRNGNHSGNWIAAKNISRPYTEKGLETEQRGESHKHPDRHPAGQRVRGVMQIQQLRNKRAEIHGDFLEHARTLAPIPPPEKTEIHNSVRRTKILDDRPNFWFEGVGIRMSIPLQRRQHGSSF